MAENTPSDIAYILHIEAIYKEQLRSIRHWGNLKIAFEEDDIWIKDFSAQQFQSLEVKTIPNKKCYELKDNRLYPQGSLLPERKMPTVLWTPIERGLPIELPKFNHNYFGVKKKVELRLIPDTTEEKEVVALRVSLEDLKNYIETAPAIRLKSLSWVILNETEAFIIGTPLLPIQGEVFWRQNNSLIPTGYDFEFSGLAKLLEPTLNPQNDAWIVWSPTNQYFNIQKNDFTALSIGTFREL